MLTTCAARRESGPWKLSGYDRSGVASKAPATRLHAVHCCRICELLAGVRDNSDVRSSRRYMWHILGRRSARRLPRT